MRSRHFALLLLILLLIPPVLLTEVNFQAMYEAQQAQAVGAPNGSGAIANA